MLLALSLAACSTLWDVRKDDWVAHGYVRTFAAGGFRWMKALERAAAQLLHEMPFAGRKVKNYFSFPNPGSG